MRDDHPEDENALSYRADRSPDFLAELPSCWGGGGELDCNPVADPPALPQPRAFGFIFAALSWVLGFVIGGFAAHGYAMCHYGSDPHDPFDSRGGQSGGPSRDAAPREVSPQASDK